MNNLVRTYYTVEFLYMFSLSFMRATYVVFLLERGLDLLQVNMVNGAFMVGVFIFEIPTGAFADILGRKKSFLMGCLILSTSFFMYYVSYLFLLFVIAEIIAALGTTFYSGALEAWIVDALKEAGHKDAIDTVFAKSHIIITVSSIGSGLIGAYIGNINLALPWLVASVCMVITAVTAFVLMEETHTKGKSLNVKNGLKELKNICISSVEYGIKNRIVFLLIMTSVISAFFYVGPAMFWQPFFRELSAELSPENIWILGWIWCALSAAMMGGNYLAGIVSKKMRRYYTLVVSTMICAVFLMAAAVTKNFYVALAFFLLYDMGRGLGTPIKRAYLNAHIPSKERATILSFHSMMSRLGAAAGLIGLGILAKTGSVSLAWVCGSVVMVGSIPLYFLVHKEEIRGDLYLDGN